MMLDKIFPFFKKTMAEPTVKFGRYSDAYKTKEQYQSFDIANDLFKQKQYLPAFKNFLAYLCDQQLQNVSFTENEKHINFEFIQGSKKIAGYIDETKVVAEAKIARFDKLSVSFMRKLVETNYFLRYTRFSFDEDIIYLKFDTSVVDATPQKLFYAFRELATKADKHDDLLLDSFTMLQPINTSHIADLPAVEKEHKIQYLRNWITQVLQTIEDLSKAGANKNQQVDPNMLAKGSIFILLALAYKIDYLLAPQGKLMDIVEKIHGIYFTNLHLSLADIVGNMTKEFAKISKMSNEDIQKELYKAPATFGIVNRVSPPQLVGFITTMLDEVNFYQEHKYDTVVSGLINYTVQYIMFDYGLPKVLKDFFHLIIVVNNMAFFKNLGFHNVYYDDKQQKICKKAINKKINFLQKEARKFYPNFLIRTKKLKFSTLSKFSSSLLHELTQVDYSI